VRFTRHGVPAVLSASRCGRSASSVPPPVPTTRVARGKRRASIRATVTHGNAELA